MSTFCAGCHDPVLLLSGGFDDPRLDDPTIDPASIPGATAGINCLICHSISHVDPFGNGSWTITPPTNYPFHDSTSAPLQWLHRQLMRSRPGFHKASMNRPGVTDSATLCGTCHKAWIPEGLNDHRWLHGQNHYDSWRLSGVSGHGVESWRWPSDPSTDCNGCHMPLRPSDDIAARDRDGSGTPTIHDHLFAAGNTALPVLLDLPDRDRVLAAHERSLSESMRVDIVGLREEGRIDGAFIGPLRPELPALEPGSTWLLEVVSRNLGVGHAFTQGTADSNEIWLDLTVRAGERIIGRSGAIDDEGRVDPWAYRLNAFLVDSEGRHVQNRAPETIFTSVYDHQVPPGSATVTHYRLVVPEDVVGPLEIEVAIRYRKFDRALMDFVYGEGSGAEMVGRLPAMIVASDDIMLPTTVDGSVDREQPPPAPTWERLYDYGIGLQHAGSRGPLRQAEETFRRVAALGRAEGDFGLARVQLREGRYPEAVEALDRLAREPGTVPAWGVTYLSGVADRERGLLEEALVRFRSLADEQPSEYPRATQLGFDFSGDDALLLDIAAIELRLSTPDDLDQLEVVLDRCDRVIRRNPQDFRAWWLRAQALTLGGSALDERASNAPIVGAAFPASLRSLADAEVSGTPGGWERLLHDTFRPDAQARERAVRAARRAYPWVDHAAEPGAIYDLHRTGGLR